MNNIYIIEAKRTPIGSFLSKLSSLNSKDLLDECMKDMFVNVSKNDIEEIYIGNVLSAGLGQNIAGYLTNKINKNAIAITLNRVCGSGLVSIINGFKSINQGDTNCVLVGGVESMSNSPHLLKNSRNGKKYGNIEMIDSILMDGLTDCLTNKHMGELTEDLNIKFNISKDDQDKYSKMSYTKARNAVNNLKFYREISPINIKNNIIDQDEEINKILDLNKLDNLKPVFNINGTITAGNASKLSDGASLLILSSEKYIKENNIKPLSKIIGYNMYTNDSSLFPIAPIQSIKNLCEKYSYDINDIDVFEINEAFAICPIFIHKELKIPYEKINLYGGAISLGHPIGCSGARIVTTLINILINENKKIGCASICNGGGGATTILIENINYIKPPLISNIEPVM
jgi:acetyl-CoA C-acetyltransferase